MLIGQACWRRLLQDTIIVFPCTLGGETPSNVQQVYRYTKARDVFDCPDSRNVVADCQFPCHNGDHLRGEERRVPLLGRGKCKLLASFSTSVVTSLPSARVSLFVSFSPSAPRTRYQVLQRLVKLICRQLARRHDCKLHHLSPVNGIVLQDIYVESAMANWGQATASLVSLVATRKSTDQGEKVGFNREKHCFYRVVWLLRCYSLCCYFPLFVSIVMDCLPQEGQTFNIRVADSYQYTVGKKIGHGRFGQVFAATRSDNVKASRTSSLRFVDLEKKSIVSSMSHTSSPLAITSVLSG